MELFTNKPEIISEYMEVFDNNFSVMSVGYHNFHYIEPFKSKRLPKIYTLHFILSGHGVMELYGKKYRLSEHQMFLIPIDADVCYYPDPKDPWSYVWIDFVGDIAPFFVDRMGFSNDTPFFTCSSPFSVYSHFKNFFDTFEQTGEAGYFSALALFYSVMDVVSIKQKKVRAQTLKEQVQFYIDIHFPEANFKISNICSFFNISHSYLCSLFKEGDTVKDILIKKRIEEAKRLLFESDLFVGEVGRSVGFANIDHFMKTFKLHTGMTAAEYRRYARSKGAEESKNN